ncbi:MAG TPA: hypothetical protein PL196_00720 [Burkholderiaceae bacterium]|nr:hypothetical protein [Burkholderiaceae bacterium]
MSARARAVVIALAAFAVWALATWALEGRILTLLRPDAVAERMVYALVGNLLLGIVAGAGCVAYFVRTGAVHADRAGFGSTRRTVLWSVTGLALGLSAYVLQGAPSLDPTVIVNAFSQVFVVSAAEVVICWSVVGASIEAAVEGRGRLLAAAAAGLVAALLFGLYHFAHSPPFNTWAMVGLLSAVGVVTGLFFFVSRDLIGTAIFHNFLGTFGVLQALSKAGALGSLERLQPPLVATAAVTLLVVAGLQVFVRRQPAPKGRGPVPD